MVPQYRVVIVHNSLLFIVMHITHQVLHVNRVIIQKVQLILDLLVTSCAPLLLDSSKLAWKRASAALFEDLRTNNRLTTYTACHHANQAQERKWKTQYWIDILFLSLACNTTRQTRNSNIVIVHHGHCLVQNLT